MGSSRSVRSVGLALGLAVVVTAALSGQAWTQGPGYGSPTWAPDWFRYCTNPKQWVQWTLPNQIMEWGVNYFPLPAMPTLTLGTDNTLSVWMANYPVRDYYKQVWVEIFYNYSGKVPNFSSPTQPLLEWSGGWTKLLEQGNPVGPGLPFGWYNEADSGQGRFTAYYEIFPQPGWEKFTLSWSVGDPSFTTVRMLTQCNPIPEPMSMVLAGLGLGAVGALRRRR